MRVIGLGQWLYFAWHLPALLLCLAAAGLGLAMVRSLLRDDLSARARQRRYQILGWSAMVGSTLSVVAWPYLTAFAEIRVEGDGRWLLSNYLGVPLGLVDAPQVRVLEGEDLGGLHVGAGRLQVMRSDGAVFTSVRISGPRFDAARRALGYADEVLRDHRGSVRIDPHRYGSSGPSFTLAALPPSGSP